MKLYTASEWFEEKSSGYVLETEKTIYEVGRTPNLIEMQRHHDEELGTSWRLGALGLFVGITPNL